MKTLATFVLAVLVAILASPSARADAALSIYDIQYTTAVDGASQYNGSVVNCLGGVVIKKISGFYPRLVLYNPANPNGWGGIMVKDWMGGSLVSNVSVGDWVSLVNVGVEEYRGNTFLQYKNELSPSFVIESSGNALPDPIMVSASDIAAPLETSNPPYIDWLVENHSAEKYEAMLLKVLDVTVTAMHLGKASDIYNLHDSNGDDLWAADYINVDRVGYYLPAIAMGEDFVSVTGILEQYTNTGWDYYQLLTRTEDDVVVPEPATISTLIIMAGLAFLRGGVFRKR